MSDAATTLSKPANGGEAGTEEPTVKPSRPGHPAGELGPLLQSIVHRLERVAAEADPQARPPLQEALAAARLAAGIAEAAAEPTTPAGDACVTTPSAVRRETVLVVDDNAGVRRLVVRQLTELGYRALEAEDGPSALMMLNTHAVDLLFTDVVMPGGMSGFDLARLVLSRWPAMKALITSGFPDLEPNADSAAQAKLQRLIKPYRKADLANALREVLDGPAATH